MTEGESHLHGFSAAAHDGWRGDVARLRALMARVVSGASSQPLSQHSARQTATLVRDCMQHCRFTIRPAISLQSSLTAGACTLPAIPVPLAGRVLLYRTTTASRIAHASSTRFRFRVSMRATAGLATQYGHQNTPVPGPAYSLYFGFNLLPGTAGLNQTSPPSPLRRYTTALCLELSPAPGYTPGTRLPCIRDGLQTAAAGPIRCRHLRRHDRRRTRDRNAGHGV